MNASKITLNSDRRAAKNNQQRKERTLLMLIVLSIIGMAIFGIYYTQQYMTGKEQAELKKVDPVQQQLQQECDQKLQQYLAEGGVDLEKKLLYGDLQGCRFSSESERRVEKLGPNKSSRFNME